MRHCAASARGRCPRRLRDDVGGQLVPDEGGAVTQHEFSLLEPLNLEDVRSRRNLQRFDRDIEVAMFLPQPYKLSPHLDFTLFGRCRRSVPATYLQALL